ncbi:MAG TPA: ATP-dependent RecD-like DNA helicase [Candidatus Paceibacterota bacterium]|nr:ATP-dependent RecD-like DNA helicase [Candidatus Pacearchaeota archaeon]HRZ50619.1 ATP-dependent RecD-like DNA helicase [Candidatus Paceibacterota bacterium]HSA36484.1 ATP-dependent RecD-like DNA helicase [Candidatus Paceibacterota bacterium]
MRNVDEQINISNEAICKLIDTFGAEERGFLSQNILDKLRTFVEAVSVKAAGETEYSYDIFQDKAKHYVAARADLRFLSKFHRRLQESKSHYASNEEASERLMLKYYEYLLKTKSFLKTVHGFDVLHNIDKFPLNTDRTLNEYYEKITKKINELEPTRAGKYEGRFYVQKIKPFFVDQKVFYEVTFRIADDKISKFDRLIAFTKLEITVNYAVDFFISKDYIEVSNKKMPIRIIDNWKVSIRPCEFKNFEKIFNHGAKEYNKTVEYFEIMSFLTETGLNLIEIVNFPDSYYIRFKQRIAQRVETHRILDLLDKSREFLKNSNPGSNILRYLLYNLNNRIIKGQYDRRGNAKLSNLNLSYKCIPFDEMPFATFPVNHTPVISDLLDCIDSTGREHEFLARHITNNAEIKGWLYSPIEDLDHFDKIDELIEKFNGLLYQNAETQRGRKLEKYKDFVYIVGYENAVVEIVRKLKDLSTSGIRNYSNSINAWLSSPDSRDIDCPQKKEVLRGMFTTSKVSLIYGAAGTGKTKLIEHISKFHNERSKLYLANTHSAVSNLKSRITAQNTEFKTIRSFLNGNIEKTAFDILIIDECSVVSNLDMRDILRKASFGALILVGDIFQIESIRFGNWFYIAKSFISDLSVIELTTPWRAKDNRDLLNLWSKVRNLEEDIVEHITQNKYSTRLDNSIFEHSENDEIILCLNYDGFYGINNINRFLQESNEDQPVTWGVHTYKVHDPILFNESNRFGSAIHNNLKGKILDIQTFGDRIQFDIQIDKSISELDILGYPDIELLDSIEEAKSVIRFSVNELKNTDEDDDDSASDIVPFQVAYAVSIHKAQGLEYDSVKVVITNEIEERISHNIFYTAITRAKKKLKIYWSPETEKKILDNLEKKFDKRDACLLKEKFNL